MRAINVEYPREVIGRFRAAARKAFPYETFAYLLGHALGTVYMVEDIWIPPDVAAHATKSSVTVPHSWLLEAREAAKDEDLRVIGDIHSHPRTFRQWGGMVREVTPSAGDHAQGWPDGICGICVVTQQVNGQLTTRVKFYGPIHAVREVPK